MIDFLRSSTNIRLKSELVISILLILLMVLISLKGKY